MNDWKRVRMKKARRVLRQAFWLVIVHDFDFGCDLLLGFHYYGRRHGGQSGRDDGSSSNCHRRHDARQPSADGLCQRTSHRGGFCVCRFLLMIGLSLVADGFGFHIPKGYLYAAIGFSVMIEFFNQLAARNLRKHTEKLPFSRTHAFGDCEILMGRARRKG